MAGMIFADAHRIFHWILDLLIPWRFLSLAAVTVTAGVSAVLAAVDDAHPVSVGAGFLSLAALLLNAYVIYKSNREKALEANQEAMRNTLHGLRKDLNRRNLESTELRQDFLAVTDQLRIANATIEQLRKELHEANGRLAGIATGVDHLSKGVDDALSRGSQSGD